MPRFDLPRCAVLILPDHRCCLPEHHGGDHLFMASEDVQWDLYEALEALMNEVAANNEDEAHRKESGMHPVAHRVDLVPALAALAKARGESVPAQSPGDHQESNAGAQGGQDA